MLGFLSGINHVAATGLFFPVARVFRFKYPDGIPVQRFVAGRTEVMLAVEPP